MGSGQIFIDKSGVASVGVAPGPESGGPVRGSFGYRGSDPESGPQGPSFGTEG